MPGFEGFLFDVLLPALFIGLFGFAIAVEICMDWHRSHRWSEGSQPSTVPALKKLFQWAAVFVWMIMMMFVVYRGLRIHYDLWALQSHTVEAVSVVGHQVRDRSSISYNVSALNERDSH